jgi:hypothetical protein
LSKRKRITTQAVIERRIKEGRGQGYLSEYKPWLTVHDVPSHGVVTRILGWKTNRIHHYFSEHYELAHHYEMEWASDCCDIREQYPLLPLEKTLFIAEKLGIKHPIDPKTKYPIVMTTDMLLTFRKGDEIFFIAHAIKPKSKLNKRVMEKFEIEKLYFKDLGIQWALITEDQINYDLVRNVEWLHSAKNLDDEQFPSKIIRELEPALYQAIQKSNNPLAKITLEMDEKIGVEPGTSMHAVRHFIANRRWIVDMSKRIIPTLQPLKIIKIAEEC